MIEKEKIDSIKTTVDIKTLVESKGIKLKKNGKGLREITIIHGDIFRINQGIG